MATSYSGNLDITPLGRQRSHGRTTRESIADLLAQMRAQRPNPDDRDIEPFDTSQNIIIPTSTKTTPTSTKDVIERLIENVGTDLKKQGMDDTQIDTIKNDFGQSIDYWQLNNYAGELTKEGDTTESEEDSAIGSRKYEFHTMTALGKNRTVADEVVIKGMSSIPTQVTSMIQYLLILSRDDELIAGSYKLSTPKTGFSESECLTKSNVQDLDEGVNGIYLVHYFVKDSSDNFTKSYIGIQYWQIQYYPSDPVIEAPVQEPHNNETYHNIVIGLGRGAHRSYSHSDADYRYSNKPTGQALIPFKGSVDFGSAIDINNLRAKFFLTTANGSVRTLKNPDWTQPNPNWTKYIKVSSTNNHVLEWDWQTNDDLADFGRINWGVDQAAYLHFEVGVKTDDSNNEFVYAQIHSVDADTVPDHLQITNSTKTKFIDNTKIKDEVMDGIAYIYPVEHSWHCVASGTRVTMGNGSTKTIDQIRGGEVLRTDARNTMEVRSTVEQPVMDTDTVYELTDSKGNTLVITGDHWIAQPNGYKPVAELALSDEILTASGTATIRSLKQVDFKGTVLSLSLGNHQNRPTIGFEGTTFVANNILVGDNQLCRIQNLLRLKDHDHQTAKLPPRWKAVADELRVLASR